MRRRMWRHQHSSHTVAYVQVVHLNKIFFRNSSHYTVNDVMRQNTAHIGNGFKVQFNLTSVCVTSVCLTSVRLTFVCLTFACVTIVHANVHSLLTIFKTLSEEHTPMKRSWRRFNLLCSFTWEGMKESDGGWRRRRVTRRRKMVQEERTHSLTTQPLTHWIHAHSTLSRYTGSTLTQHWVVTLDPHSLNTQHIHRIHTHSTLSRYTGSTLTQHWAVTLDPCSLNTQPLHWIHAHSTLSRYTGSTLTQHSAYTLDPHSLNTEPLH